MTIIRKLFDALLGVERVVVTEGERLLVSVNGQYKSIYGAGEQAILRRGKQLGVQRFMLDNARLDGSTMEKLTKARPDLTEAHMTEVRTGPQETAVVYRDGRPFDLIGVDARAWYWTDAGPWSVERFDISADLALSAALVRRLPVSLPAARGLIWRANVDAEQVGLLFVDGVFDRQLAPGAHAFWMAGPALDLKRVDLRRTALEITQQELLTKDRVTIRVNLSVIYKVVDPVAAVTGTRDFSETLYREAQFALRRTLGAKTLDQILAEKVDIDATPVREAMSALGVEVSELAMKDVILPGDMRAILNQVVAAEKEAEANVIRRREETNATRSLLNTAKVMAENPVMLRLKELEALQELAGKVERLTVHNGTEGLMNDLVRLRD